MAFRLHLRAAALAGAALVAGGAAGAKDKTADATSPLVRSLIACREIADDGARLRCFDGATGSIASALRDKTVVMVDRAQIEEAKRDDFGVRHPRDLPLPDGAGGKPLDSLEGVIVAAGQAGDGTWIVTLKDGTVWRQTDDTPLGLPPRAGDKVVVTRAALGSFKLKVGKAPAMRVRRVA